MKKILLGIGLGVLCLFNSYGQDALRHCAADHVYQEQMKNPKIKEARQMIEDRTQQFMQRGGVSSRSGVLSIPVIVHVIYSNSQENISNAQIQSQIDVLNEDFRALNSDISGTPSEFPTADMEIEFVLSQVTRKSSARTSWGTNDDMKKLSQGGVDPIDPANNINMWVCNIGGGILGYAQFPGGPASTDGVVMSPQYFGSSDKGTGFYLSAPFDKGRTTTHEVGHYLNLRHIWGDGNCSADDFVSDTPTAAAANYGCPSYPSKSCTNNGGFTSDMFMNYMDYVDDDCMFMFSPGQKARVDAIFEPGGAREGLGTTTGGCTLPAPTGVSASNVQDNSFDVSWSAVTDAVSYDVSVDGSVSNTTGTSISISGLTAGTTYAVSVRANCASGSGAYSSAISVTTTGSNCKTGASLTLVTDNYGSETSWTLTKDGSQVASGSGYSNNTTYNADLDYGPGSYVFTINDSYGDGICCSYGNGSYTIEDGGGSVIASGGDFGSSEQQSWCLEGSAPDTQAPTAPGSLSSSGITETSIDLSWSASSDNVGVTGYDVYVDGSLDGSTASTSYTVSGLTASTTYTLSVRAKDAAGNESSPSSISETTAAPPGLSCATTESAPYSESFENTLGSWSNASGDDFDWALRSGGTPSSNTGPSSASDGSYYVYVESSSPNYSNKTAILEGPCFDLSGATNPTLAFKYHMYGASGMGGLVLQATTDDNSWSTIWSESGNQGNSWLDASVDMSSFNGGSVKTRFVGTTGTTWQGDMAIDDLSLTDGTTGGGNTTVTLTIVLDNYPEETSWSIVQGGSTIASGGTYGSQPDGSTVVEDIDLADGCYDFVINDAYGDGICCAYGNGSYSLTSGGSTLASGGSFGSSESTNFCVGTGRSGFVDTRNHSEFRGVFDAYPNPVTDVLNINILDIKATSYSIHDLSGKQLLHGQIIDKHAEVSMESLPRGFYLLKVMNSKGDFTKKIVKQ